MLSPFWESPLQLLELPIQLPELKLYLAQFICQNIYKIVMKLKSDQLINKIKSIPDKPTQIFSISTPKFNTYNHKYRRRK